MDPKQVDIMLQTSENRCFISSSYYEVKNISKLRDPHKKLINKT